MQPEPGLYEHYKGKRYEVLFIARHSETLDELVVYRALCDKKRVWVRPRAMFIEDVTVDGRVMPRFRRVTAARPGKSRSQQNK